MMSVAWQDESEIAKQNAPIRGITVGQNEVTLEEMWRSTPTTKYQRY
jgi:hypothetical protein